MDGLLIIDKPAGLTSHDVVARVRRILRTKRVGHTGTLDPFATGVMVVLIGRATRLAQFLDRDEKEYEAVMRFGSETDTGDLTGEMTRKSDHVPSRDELEKILPRFVGEIMQTPPMYSAKKVAGKKLYELARAGETIERDAVKLTIRELEIKRSDAETAAFRVVCSAGTYVRTLAEDIARAAGAAAHLTELRRTRSGRFGLDESVTLDKLASLGDPAPALTAMHEAVSRLPRFELSAERSEKTRNGLSSRVFDDRFTDGEAAAMFDPDGHLIAVGRFNDSENTMQPVVVLV